MKRLDAFRLIALLAIIIVPVSLMAQRTAASISGTVMDQSGAVIPAANITVTEVTTGVPTAAQANGHGFYLISNLQPGAYKLHVEKAGFEGYERTGMWVRQVNRLRLQANCRW